MLLTLVTLKRSRRTNETAADQTRRIGSIDVLAENAERSLVAAARRQCMPLSNWIGRYASSLSRIFGADARVRWRAYELALQLLADPMDQAGADCVQLVARKLRGNRAQEGIAQLRLERLRQVEDQVEFLDR